RRRLYRRCEGYRTGNRHDRPGIPLGDTVVARPFILRDEYRAPCAFCVAKPAKTIENVTQYGGVTRLASR
ncbi:MAG: hypothetical protein OEY41_09730, partial [Acidimicrobiia bacterium]|nr:hypothetical protein [Acidimicrobiia bacterium]